MMRSSSAILLLLVPLAALPAAAQTRNVEATTIASVPFGVGERAEYRVRLGGIGVGNGSMEVVDVVNIQNFPTYHLRFLISGGIPLARVNNRLESWLDVGQLMSRRFEQDQREVGYRRHRVFDLYPEQLGWSMVDLLQRGTPTPETGDLASALPLDDVSFLYFVRTIPLEVGQTYTYDRYFRDSGNPVVLKVLRKETVRVPAGTFETIVVQPTIQTRGLFSQGGRAEVYFTDDERRLLVQLRSSVPVIGSLALHLERYQPGQRLTPGALSQRAAP